LRGLCSQVAEFLIENRQKCSVLWADPVTPGNSIRKQRGMQNCYQNHLCPSKASLLCLTPPSHLDKQVKIIRPHQHGGHIKGSTQYIDRFLVKKVYLVWQH
jgi:hypothetical protein